MIPERMNELYRGCAYCEGLVDGADCMCPTYEEVRTLIDRIRQLEGESQTVPPGWLVGWLATFAVFFVVGLFLFTFLLTLLTS